MRPADCFYVFRMDFRASSSYFPPYNNNLTVIVTETERVYCALST